MGAVTGKAAGNGTRRMPVVVMAGGHLLVIPVTMEKPLAVEGDHILSLSLPTSVDDAGDYLH